MSGWEINFLGLLYVSMKKLLCYEDISKVCVRCSIYRIYLSTLSSLIIEFIYRIYRLYLSNLFILSNLYLFNYRNIILFIRDYHY